MLRTGCRTLRTQYSSTCLLVKFNSTSSFNGTDGGPPDTADQGAVQKLPRRLVKRLQKQGVTEDEFLSKINAFTEAKTKPLGSTVGSSVDSSAKVDSREQLEHLLRNMTTEPHHLIESDSFPSDSARYRLWEKQLKASQEDGRPRVAPSATSVVLFPGQGSQFVGMGKKLLEFPGVNDLYEEASAVLGYNLLNLCLRGPKTELNKTVYCQPAVMITSLAAIEKFREEHPQAVENCVATAGFSVGEFAALVFAGVISFPDAVKVVKLRAEAMQKASEQVGSGMLTVFLAHDSNLKEAIRMAKEYCQERHQIENPVCTVANYLFPECKVLAGHEEAIEFIAANAKEFNILRTKRLPVSGAFHTNLMSSAVKPLQQQLDHLPLGKPKIPVYSNVTSSPYHTRANYSHILGQQIVKPVRWEQILHSVYSRRQGEEFPHTYEMGPGKQMGTFLKQVNLQAHKQYHNVDV